MFSSKTVHIAALLWLGCSLASTASAANAEALKSRKASSSFTVGATVADPCLNSDYLHLPECRGRYGAVVVKNTYEEVKMFSRDYEVMQGFDKTYLVRTFDY